MTVGQYGPVSVRDHHTPRSLHGAKRYSKVRVRMKRGGALEKGVFSKSFSTSGVLVSRRCSRAPQSEPTVRPAGVRLNAMCGRYVLKASALDLQAQFHLDEVPQLFARYNIAPTQAAPIILDAAPRKLVVAQWGLVPHWAKDPKIAHQFINARAETLSEKGVFKELLEKHRCLVPADGFYEWRHEGKQRLPHFVHPPGGQLMAMAGLWSRWRSPEGMDLNTFVIVTTRANAELQSLHDRMPVLLDAEGRQRWLSGATHDFAALEELMHPWHQSKLEVTEVSTHVNSVAVDDPQCLQPPAVQQLRLL